MVALSVGWRFSVEVAGVSRPFVSIATLELSLCGSNVSRVGCLIKAAGDREQQLR